MKKLQRLFYLLLSLALVLTFASMSVFAEEATTDEEQGTPKPIEIRTVEDLYNVRNDLTADYVLMNDIDLTAATAKGGDWDYGGRGWNPIGSNDVYSDGAFSGTFDGNGYSIIGMRIEATSYPSGTGTVYAGLFANVAGTVKNVHMKDAKVSINRNSNSYIYVGTIAGYVKTAGTISGCSVSGSAYGYNGYSGGSNYIVYCGGIVGYSNGTIQSCFNTASVNAERGYNAYAGGIAGYLYGSSSQYAKITDCYNTGTVNGRD